MTEADRPGRPEHTGPEAQRTNPRGRSSPARTNHLRSGTERPRGPDTPISRWPSSSQGQPTSPTERNAIDAGTWLLTTTADSVLEDPLPHRISQALERRGVRCTILGPNAVIGRLTGATGIIAIAPPLTGPAAGRARTEPGHRLARWLTRLLRHLPDLAGAPPRLCIVTRTHHSSPPGITEPSADQRLTVLLDTIRARYPRLRTAHIDLDDATDLQDVTAKVLADTAVEERIT
ncbi:hypothetical protein [Streptomyces sp. Ac-502]|uniref:hypothetical protein n=1 Tax=Streptomyces sp. Ac-502 TaxID=3342801 RepID=UPI00386278FB